VEEVIEEELEEAAEVDSEIEEVEEDPEVAEVRPYCEAARRVLCTSATPSSALQSPRHRLTSYRWIR
jgi:hypothetical protein